MPTNLKNKYAIVGIGETQVGKRPNVTTLALHLEAMKKAMDDAGLKPGDVDGVLTNQPLHDPHRSYGIVLGRAAGITVKYTTDLAMGGATPVGMAIHAAMAIEAGLATSVVCVHARNNATMSTVTKRGTVVRNGNEEFEEPWGMVGAVGEHASAAARYAYEYGDPTRGLGAIAIAFRKHATMNANATMKKTITMDDYMASRWVVEPLRLLDCCLVSDGGGAFVVTSAERARDLPKKPVYIAGFGSHNPHSNLLNAPTLTAFGGKYSSGRTYAMAGLGPKDMNFAQMYDCFTITVLVTLEDYGFCGKGECADWVQGGRIEVGGELPVNTHGGLLSQAHIEGMLHVTEAVKQLRGGEVEPARQIANAKVGLVTGHGGPMNTHASLILSNEPV